MERCGLCDTGGQNGQSQSVPVMVLHMLVCQSTTIFGGGVREL